MGKGLAFLNLKFFHPNNRDNQKRKWEALQRDNERQKKVKERELELEKEKELTEYRLKLLAQGEDKSLYEKELKKSEVAFLYNEPPGLKKSLENERRRLEEEKRQKEWHQAMQTMSREERRLAERDMQQGLSVLERKLNRFEFLKNAPVKAGYVRDIDVEFKPFGIDLKNMQCFKCMKWGHRIGDRECPESHHFADKYAIKDNPPPRYPNQEKKKKKKKCK